MVHASVEAASSSGGTAAELLTRTRVAGPAGSQARASVGTSDSKNLPPSGSWIGYEVRAQGNERRGDRVRIELRYSWEVKFHDVNENQQSVLIEIDGSPRGKVFNLAWESFTQQAGNAMDRSGSGTSYFDTRVGERFDLSAVSTLTTLAAGPTGEADLTELRLTYSLTARYLGPLGPPVRITSVRPLNDARGTYGVRISFNGQVLNGIYDIGSGEFASVKLISKGAPTIRIRSVSLDLATLRQATILFDRPIPANRKVTLVIEGSRIYAEGLLTRSIDARGNGVEGSQYRGVIQGRRIRQV
jgi:hypothetical protein